MIKTIFGAAAIAGAVTLGAFAMTGTANAAPAATENGASQAGDHKANTDVSAQRRRYYRRYGYAPRYYRPYGYARPYYGNPYGYGYGRPYGYGGGYGYGRPGVGLSFGF